MWTQRGLLTLVTAFLAAIGCENPTDPVTHFAVRVSGVARDAVTGQPIAGAEVIRSEIDLDCDIDKNGAIDCQTSRNRIADFTDSLGRYQLSYREEGFCGPCEHHDSGQCMSTSLLVKHSDYEAYPFSPEILCQSEPQTLPDVELEPLGA